MLKHSLLFFLFFSLWDIFRKKRYFVEKIPILGEGGGLPTWEFFPLNTVFNSEGVPNVCPDFP